MNTSSSGSGKSKGAFPPNGPFPPSEKYTAREDIHPVMVPGFKVSPEGGVLHFSPDPSHREGFFYVTMALQGSDFDWLRARSMPTRYNVSFILPIRLPAAQNVESIALASIYFQDPNREEKAWIALTAKDPVILKFGGPKGEEVEIHMRLPLPAEYNTYAYNGYGQASISKDHLYTTTSPAAIDSDYVRLLMRNHSVSLIQVD